MRRQLRNAALFSLLSLVVWLPACQKKCQQNTQRLTTFVDQEFRLVQTNDPKISKDLTNTNFLIFSFKIDYTGAVSRVEDNSRYNNPTSLIRYNVDPAQKLIKVIYYNPPEEGSTSPLGEQIGKEHIYQYQLGTEFLLREVGTPYGYRFVPFQGVVRPDDQCTF